MYDICIYGKKKKIEKKKYHKLHISSSRFLRENRISLGLGFDMTTSVKTEKRVSIVLY